MQTSSTPVELFQQKNIAWETDFNKKLGCTAFLHFDLAPANLPGRAVVDNTIIQITTTDNSHPPVKVKLLDIVVAPLVKYCIDAITLSSHGLNSFEYAQWVMDQKYPGRVNWATPFAIYYYKKLL